MRRLIGGTRSFPKLVYLIAIVLVVLILSLLVTSSATDTYRATVAISDYTRYYSATELITSPSSAAITLTVNPSGDAEVVEVRLHLYVKKDLSDFALTLDSGLGDDYDVVLYTATGITSHTDLVVDLHAAPIILPVADDLICTLADKSTTVALEVVYKNLRR